MKRKRKIDGPFAPLPLAILDAAAWCAMSPEGRLLWIDLRRWLRNDRLNNGKVHRSCRDAAKSIGLSKNTVARRFVELEHYGFLRKTAPGFLGSDGRGIAAKYRFTDLAHGTHPPTRDYEKWDGELFAYTPRGGRNYVPSQDRKKQNPVPREGTPCTTGRDIRGPLRGPSVCTTGRDIGSASNCPTGRDISRLPPQSEEREQGSSTVRAPVQAGGAGSSPAPVATPCLRRLYELSTDPRAMLEVGLCGPRERYSIIEEGAQ